MVQNNTIVKKGRCLNFGNCNKANTKEIIEINISEDFQCPECQGELVEVKTNPTPWGIIIGGIIVVLSIAASTFFFFTQNEKTTTSPGGEGGKTTVNSDVLDTLTQSSTKTEIKLPAGEEVKQHTETETKTTDELQEPANSGIVTKDLGYAVWTGKIKNGKPHDVQGTLVFKTSHIIDPRDDKGRTAKPGDKVIGTFEDGHLTQGKWYKSDDNVESIILGGL